MTRAADATIKGYYYQFDTSILKLLELPNNSDSIIIEGIEDIDIESATETTLIQCKYLSKPKFINSAVRSPIILMLDHFIDSQTPNNFKYVLYSHFENKVPGNEPVVDLTRLKSILTYSVSRVQKHYEIEKSITDIQLNAFLTQFSFMFGTEFHAQQKQVLDIFRATFSCSELEADIHFYNNALRIVIDKAINRNELDRKITKREFIEAIDCRQNLFNEWFIKLRSKKEYLKLLAQNLNATKVLNPHRTKIVLIGKNIINADNSELPIESFIENLINKYYKLNSSLRNAKPITIVLDCNQHILKGVKEYLIENETLFNDGYEYIKFSPSLFNKEPIITKSNNGQKIVNSSYMVKLISYDTFSQNISLITNPKILLTFSKEDLPERFPNGQFFDIKYCGELKDVFKLLVQ